MPNFNDKERQGIISRDNLRQKGAGTKEPTEGEGAKGKQDKYVCAASLFTQVSNIIN